MIAHGVWQLEQFGRFVGFVARTLAGVAQAGGGAVWRGPVAPRGASPSKSLPCVLGAGISVGLVTSLQHAPTVLWPTVRIPRTAKNFLAVAVVVEISPVLAGVLVASRIGAGLAAELGSMRLNEEIETRSVLGADPVPSLVAPRAIACALAVPLLTVLIDASALLRALVGEVTAGKLSPLLL